jgi:hypothetical protein
MLEGFELGGILFLILMCYLTFVSYKRKELSKGSSTLWYAVWIISLIGISFNKYFSKFLGGLDISRIFDLYTLVGFMFFLVIIFSLFKSVKRSEVRIEELTRILALKSLKKKQ